MCCFSVCVYLCCVYVCMLCLMLYVCCVLRVVCCRAGGDWGRDGGDEKLCCGQSQARDTSSGEASVIAH